MPSDVPGFNPPWSEGGSGGGEWGLGDGLLEAGGMGVLNTSPLGDVWRGLCSMEGRKSNEVKEVLGRGGRNSLNL